MSELAVQDVSIKYGEFTALSSIDLSVGSGEVVAVVGPSGCGKSSLLRAIAGLEPLATGSISLGGNKLDGIATHKRDLGLMFQSHALFPHMSVGENVEFGLRMKKVAKDERSLQVGQLLSLVGLDGMQGRNVESLSGGEAQRVALARALAPSPGLLMLDEPLGSLDRVLRTQLVSDLRSLFSRLGVTALHVTHDQTEAFALADKIVVLSDGVVEQLGKPADVWRQPKSAFVATFLGHPNVWSSAKGEVLVPLSALTTDLNTTSAPDAPGANLRSDQSTVQVESVEFQEGRFRIGASSGGATFCGLDVGPVLVVFDTWHEPMVGENITVRLDRDQVVTF